MLAWKHSSHSHMAWLARQPQQRPGQVCAPQPWQPETRSAHGEMGTGSPPCWSRGWVTPASESRLRTKGLSLTPCQSQASPVSPVSPAPQCLGRVQSQCGACTSPWSGCPREPVCAWAGCQPRDSCATIRAALGVASPARVQPARFLPSPWSRRDRLGNPIMVRLRRRVDFGFIAVSVLNRE